MLGVESAPAWVQAALLIGVVLLEAMALYVGYGFVEETLGGPVVERIKHA
jgi:hypothetical protein